ncbi:MAG: hypothetical protein ACOYB0_09670 [Polynucleobacter sp.]
MTLGTEVKIDLVLLAQKYKEGLAQVDGSTTATGKIAERVFMRMEKDAQQAAAMYNILGNDSQKLTADQKNLEASIARLTRAGFSAQSAEVQALVADYKKLKSAGGDVERTQKTLGQSFASLRDVMQGPVAAARMVVEALKQVVKIGSDLYMEYAQAEKGQIVFAQAMKESNQISVSGAAKLKAYAQELQQLTGLDADNTQAIMGNLAAQGKSEEQILAITEAAANYAAGAGIDYNTAITQLSSTLEGTTGKLGRTNGAIKALTAEQLKHGDAISIINQQYKGMAEEVGKSAMGAVDRLKANTGDLKEALGEVVAYKFGPLIESMTNAAKEAADKISAKTNIGKVLAGDSTDIDNVRAAMIEIQNEMSDLENKKQYYDKADYLEMYAPLEKAYAALKKIHTETYAVSSAEEKASDKAKAEANKLAAAIKSEEEAAKAATAASRVMLDTWAAMNVQGAGITKMEEDRKRATDALVSSNLGLLYTENALADAEAQARMLAGLKAAQDELAKMAEKAAQVGGIISSNITSAIQEMVNAFAEGDGAKGFFKLLIRHVGQAIIAMGALIEAEGWMSIPPNIPYIVQGGLKIAAGAAVIAGANAMAEGGSGTVTKPTLFLAGEAGPEDFAFGPKSKGGLSGGGVTQIFNIQGSLLNTRELQDISMAGMAKAARSY